VFAGLYPASKFNCLQSISNIALDTQVQEALPAVQMSCLLRMFKQPSENGGTWLSVLKVGRRFLRVLVKNATVQALSQWWIDECPVSSALSDFKVVDKCCDHTHCSMSNVAVLCENYTELHNFELSYPFEERKLAVW